MVRAVLLIAVAACGRIGFDPLDPLGPLGHDEDGDRVADVDDACPYLPGSQADGDGDGVGDDCDPNPTVPRDQIELFATMMPGDQPFMLFGDGTWTQLADAIEFDGAPDPDLHTSGNLTLAIQVRDARVALGFDVVARIEPGDQFQ